MFLGRRDGFESNEAWINYPSPSMSWEEGLAYFESKNLDVQDFVTLLGMSLSSSLLILTAYQYVTIAF